MKLHCFCSISGLVLLRTVFIRIWMIWFVMWLIRLIIWSCSNSLAPGQRYENATDIKMKNIRKHDLKWQQINRGQNERNLYYKSRTISLSVIFACMRHCPRLCYVWVTYMWLCHFMATHVYAEAHTEWDFPLPLSLDNPYTGWAIKLEIWR